MKKVLLGLTLAMMIAGFASCGQEEKPQADVNFDESKSPIEVVSSSKSISPIPTFNLTVSNVSPFDVTGFNASAIFLDEKGKPLSTTPVEIPYDGTLDPIKPGTTVELQSLGEENAVSMKVVIKDCIYEKMNPVDKLYGKLRYSWKNKDLDKQIKAILEGK